MTTRGTCCATAISSSTRTAAGACAARPRGTRSGRSSSCATTSSRTCAPPEARLPRQILEIRVGPASDALDRFEAAWNRRAEGRPLRTLNVLTLPSLPQLVQALSPARWALLAALRASGPLSIYELAKRSRRNYKNVHTDVTQLAALGVIARTSDNRVLVPWEVLRAEWCL